MGEIGYCEDMEVLDWVGSSIGLFQACYFNSS